MREKILKLIPKLEWRPFGQTGAETIPENGFFLHVDNMGLLYTDIITYNSKGECVYSIRLDAEIEVLINDQLEPYRLKNQKEFDEYLNKRIGL